MSHNPTLRNLCLIVYDDAQSGDKGVTCQRLAGHDGEHEFLVEYKQITMHPWAQVRSNFADKANGGAFCFQSWTCMGCGAVQRMSQVNGFYTEGVCENCDYVTDLKRHGCNFTLMLGLAGMSREQMRKIVVRSGYKPPRDN